MSIFRIVVKGSGEYITSINGVDSVLSCMLALRKKIEEGSFDKHLTRVQKKFVGNDIEHKAVWKFLPEGVMIFREETEVYFLEFSGGKQEILCVIDLDVELLKLRNNDGGGK